MSYCKAKLLMKNLGNINLKYILQTKHLANNMYAKICMLKPRLSSLYKRHTIYLTLHQENPPSSQITLIHALLIDECFLKNTKFLLQLEQTSL